MKHLLVFMLLASGASFGQSSGKVWTELGVTGGITKDLDWGLEFSSRYGSNGLETFFPQATFKYKVTKWFRPSIDYRFIGDKQQAGYFDYSHRINLNADFRYTLDRLTMKSRIRYQYSFDRLVASESYDPEFDQAIRGKLAFSYDINDFFLTPEVSGELFYNPMFGPYGQQINKLRLFAGVSFDLNNAHSVSVGYMYDTKINLPKPGTRHILNLSYSYEIGAKKDKKKKK